MMLFCEQSTWTLQSLMYLSRLMMMVEYTDPIKAICTSGKKNGTAGKNMCWKLKIEKVYKSFEIRIL